MSHGELVAISLAGVLPIGAKTEELRWQECKVLDPGGVTAGQKW